MECLPESDEENILRWLEVDSTVRLTTPEQAFCLGVEVRESGKLIGYLSMRFTDDSRLQAELSFCFNPTYEKKDAPVEALDAALGFCFEGIKLHRVTSKCLTEDTVSSNTIEGAGLRREGEFLKDTRTEEGWVSSLCYAILDEEYLARPPASR